MSPMPAEPKSLEPRILSTVSRFERFVSNSMMASITQNIDSSQRNELDSHADTCVAGANSTILSTTGEKVTVKGFNTKSEVNNILIGSVAYAVDSPDNGETFIAVIHEALLFQDSMQYSLLSTTQIRCNKVQVNDTPRMFDSGSLHNVIAPVQRPDAGASSETLSIPLKMRGPFSYFDARKPTSSELANCRRIILTNDSPWNPYDMNFEGSEEAVPPHRLQASTQKRVRFEHDEHRQVKKRKQQHQKRNNISSLHKTDRCGYATSILEQERVRLAAEVCSIQRHLSIDILCNHPNESSPPCGDLTQRLISSISQTDTGYFSNSITNPISDRINDCDREIMAIGSGKKTTALTPQLLSKRWRIGQEMASRTLRATTQKGIVHVINPIDRRRKPFTKHLNYPTLNAKYYSDTVFFKKQSARGFSMAQVFTDGQGDTHFLPFKKKKEAGETLKQWVQDNGAMRELVTDGAREEGATMQQSTTLWRKVVEDFFIKQSLSEPYSQWQNRAEAEIREMKRSIWRELLATNAPKRLWCYCGESVAARRRLSALTFAKLDGRVPAEKRLGMTPDISAHAQFGWYDRCFYVDQKCGCKPGRFLGVAACYLADMVFWVLTDSGKIIARSSVYNLTDEEERNPQITRLFDDLDVTINAKLGNNKTNVEIENLEEGDMPIPTLVPPDELFASWDDQDVIEPEFQEPVKSTDVDDFTADTVDNYLQAELRLPRNGDLVMAKVVRRLRDGEGKPLGKRSSNPVLDTREYSVEFTDGTLDTITANQIAENIYSQVDEEGRHHILMDEIIDHKKGPTAVPVSEGFTISHNGNKVPRKTTCGWKLLVTWKDGSSSWCKLSDLKPSNPVEVAEYAQLNQIAEEPAFKWWVKPVLKRRDRII